MTVLGSEALAAQREVTRIHLRLWSVEELTLTAELGVTAADKRPGPCAGNGELLVREAPDGVVVGAVPVVKEPMEDRTGGRGLFLLSQLAEELEVHQLTRGKQVWSRLSHTSSGANEEGRC
ncbi:hypothetical protein [Streptomyces sp. BK239]|uniref:hypothetical protein n=1 Tax=Streptomyces sp. BK239 TaxID=2512155 RepID=UPI00102B30F8|nr:hypothetical protein [Streptomyces sp. BK239]